MNREGFPTGFFEPKWKIISKTPPGGDLFQHDWEYRVIAVPAPIIGTNQPTGISEHDISSLA